MAPEDTTTVRLRRSDADRMRSLAEARQQSVIEVVHAAIDALERQEFLRGLDEDYRRLREDPDRWAQLVAERETWDAIG